MTRKKEGVPEHEGTSPTGTPPTGPFLLADPRAGHGACPLASLAGRAGGVWITQTSFGDPPQGLAAATPPR